MTYKVLMALPQQGTETSYLSNIFLPVCVNGLTPTGDGNNTIALKAFSFVNIVLMVLPQQGTETLCNYQL